MLVGLALNHRCQIESCVSYCRSRYMCLMIVSSHMNHETSGKPQRWKKLSSNVYKSTHLFTLYNIFPLWNGTENHILCCPSFWFSQGIKWLNCTHSCSALTKLHYISARRFDTETHYQRAGWLTSFSAHVSNIRHIIHNNGAVIVTLGSWRGSCIIFLSATATFWTVDILIGRNKIYNLDFYTKLIQ